MSCLIYPAHESSSSADELKEQRALLLSDLSIPHVDAVVREINGKLVIDNQMLEGFLRILELVVVYEHFAVSRLPYLTGLDEQVSDLQQRIDSSEAYFAESGVANLEEPLWSALRSHGLVSCPLLESYPDQKTPDAYIRDLIAASPSFRESMGSGWENWIEYEEQLLWFSLHQGIPMALTDYARKANLPYYIPTRSTNHDLSYLDDLNRLMEQDIAKRLLDASSAGIRNEIQELAQLGFNVELPPSPIAGLLLEKASTPEDLIEVAFDLREKYSSFRRRVHELETSLGDPSESFKSKVKTKKEIIRVISKLDNRSDFSIRKNIESSASFFDSMESAVLRDGEFSLKKATDAVLSKPVEWVLDRFRNRKYRVLFASRDAVLRSSGYKRKVADIFGMPHSDESFFENSCPTCGNAHCTQ